MVLQGVPDAKDRALFAAVFQIAAEDLEDF
jgi:hypothetical protein